VPLEIGHVEAISDEGGVSGIPSSPWAPNGSMSLSWAGMASRVTGVWHSGGLKIQADFRG
jgi:hypothetical protein